MATSVKKPNPQADGGADDWDSSPKKAASPAEVDDWQELSPSDARARTQGSALTSIPGQLMAAITGRVYKPNGAVDAFTRNAADKATLGNLGYSKDWRDQIAQDQTQHPTASTAGSITGYGALGLGSAMIPGGPIVLGAAQGALTRPEGSTTPGLSDIERRGVQAVAGGGTGGALQLAGGIAGKAGDWAMQKAVGLKQYIPGLGNQLADEGLVGSKGFMQKQISGPGEDPGFIDRMLQKVGVTGKLPAREAAIQEALPQVKGMVPSSPSVSAVSDIGAGLVPKNPNIPIDPGNAPFVQQAESRALEAAARGNMSPGDALDVARKIDKAAYDTAMPSGRFSKTLAKADSGALRSTIKGMATDQGIPQVADNLGSEAALIQARNSMSDPVSLQQNLISHGKRGGAGMIAGLLLGHGNPYAGAAGAAAAEAASTPLALSLGGQIGTKAMQAAPYAQPGFVDEMVRKAMVNKK